MRIEVRRLGLAAFVRMNGGKLLEVVGKTFVFESEKTFEDWQVEYSNSCCWRHDSLVLELRGMLRRQGE